MKKFTATERQFKILAGLTYWIFEKAYTAERDPDDSEMLKNAGMSIKNCFDDADAACIPFWVQNAVIAYAENWRKYKNSYFDAEMAKIGIVKV